MENRNRMKTKIFRRQMQFKILYSFKKCDVCVWFFSDDCVSWHNNLVMWAAHFSSQMFFSRSNKYTFRSTKYYCCFFQGCDSIGLWLTAVAWFRKRDEWVRKKAGANRDIHLVTTNLFYLFLSERSRPQPVVSLPWEYKICIFCKVCLHISTCDRAVKQSQQILFFSSVEKMGTADK